MKRCNVEDYLYFYFHFRNIRVLFESSETLKHGESRWAGLVLISAIPETFYIILFVSECIGGH